MSETKNTQTNQKDLFSAYQQSIDKIFSNAKQYVPQHYQSITNMEQEYVQVFEAVINSTVSMQKEIARRTGISTGQTEYASKAIRDSTDEFVKMASIQNQMFLAAIDAAHQNVKTFGNSAKLYAELNRNIMRSWLSAFNTKN